VFFDFPPSHRGPPSVVTYQLVMSSFPIPHRLFIVRLLSQGRLHRAPEARAVILRRHPSTPRPATRPLSSLRSPFTSSLFLRLDSIFRMSVLSVPWFNFSYTRIVSFGSLLTSSRLCSSHPSPFFHFLPYPTSFLILYYLPTSFFTAMYVGVRCSRSFPSTATSPLG
jgi:hypothetical protein